jgi:hypothetical protein
MVIGSPALIAWHPPRAKIAVLIGFRIRVPARIFIQELPEATLCMPVTREPRESLELRRTTLASSRGLEYPLHW